MIDYEDIKMELILVKLINLMNYRNNLWLVNFLTGIDKERKFMRICEGEIGNSPVTVLRQTLRHSFSFGKLVDSKWQR